MMREETYDMEGELKNRFNDTKEKMYHMKDRTQEMIQDKPFTSIVIAATIGALVAVSISSWSRNKRTFMQGLMELF